MQTLKRHTQQNYTISFHLPQSHRDLNKPNAGGKTSEQSSPWVFGFESTTLRATSLCTTQEFLLFAMDRRDIPHRPSTNLDLWLCDYKGHLSFSGRKTEPGQLCSHQGCSGCQDRGSHTSSVGTAAQWGRQKNEEISKGLWLVKGVFF